MPAEYLEAIASQSVIDDAGLGKRITSGVAYQNQYWEGAKPGCVIVCDNKGCNTEVPSAWFAEHDADD
jgi:hypothetical protein